MEHSTTPTLDPSRHLFTPCHTHGPIFNFNSYIKLIIHFRSPVEFFEMKSVSLTNLLNFAKKPNPIDARDTKFKDKCLPKIKLKHLNIWQD